MIRECGIEVQADQKDITRESLSMEDEKCVSTLGWVPVSFSWVFAGFTNSSKTRIHTQIASSYVSCCKINSSYLGSALSSVIFFLASSSFLTHLLDLAHLELKKPAKGVSIVNLQSLLDLALTG